MNKLLIIALFQLSCLALIGGVQGSPNDYPSQVKIADICSGTLVKERFLITAAHCFYTSKAKKERRLSVGKRIKVKAHHTGKTRRVRIKRVHLHPTYIAAIKNYKDVNQATRYAKDIAVAEITAIKGLPSAEINFKELPVGTELVMTGSGCTKKKKKGPFKFGSVTISQLKFETKNNPVFISESPTVLSCKGDSGGAVFESLDIVAITTANIETSSGQYSLHLNLLDVKDWIAQIISI